MKKLALILIPIAALLFAPYDLNAKNYALFYSNEEATSVTKVDTNITIQLDSKEALLSLLFYKLKEDPNVANLHPAVPNEIQLKDIVLHDNGSISLDFNDEVMNIGSRSAEFVFINAVNNTYFSNFPEIDHIYYTVDGRRLSSLSHIDVSDGFARDARK